MKLLFAAAVVAGLLWLALRPRRVRPLPNRDWNGWYDDGWEAW